MCLFFQILKFLIHKIIFYKKINDSTYVLSDITWFFSNLVFVSEKVEIEKTEPTFIISV